MLHDIVKLKKVGYDDKIYRFYCGTLTDGLAMRNKWGHKGSDIVGMLIWKRLWGVAIYTWKPKECIGGVIVLEKDERHTGYCRLRVEGDHCKVTKYMSGYNATYGDCESLVVKKYGDIWISPKRVVDAMADQRQRVGSSDAASPAVPCKKGTTKLVPTLICPHSTSFVKDFLKRARNLEFWPTKNILDEIAMFPTLIIAAGHILSPYRDIQWRICFSHLEYVIMRALPLWVKQAYWAFTYVMEKGISGEDIVANTGVSQFRTRVERRASRRSKLCSLHFKMTLLWELEKPEAWRYESPYCLMLRLCNALLESIKKSELRHYFLPDCNTLGVFADSYLIREAKYIKTRIMADPLEVIISCPSNTEELYGSDYGGGPVREDILAGFHQLFQTVVGSPQSYCQSVELMSWWNFESFGQAPLREIYVYTIRQRRRQE